MKFIAGILAALAFTSSTIAYAGLLGDTINTSWDVPKSNSYNPRNNILVTNEVERPWDWASNWWLDVGDDYIEVKFRYGFAVSEYSIWTFSDLDFGDYGIGGVITTTSTFYFKDEYVTFTKDSVTFAPKVMLGTGRESSIWDLRFFRFTLIPAVPEPSTYAMLGLGLSLLGVAARRRKST